MKIKFLCPKCKNVINVAGKIVLSAMKENEERALILLDENVGDHKVFYDKSFKIKKSEKVEFFCPICQKSLLHKKHQDLVKIIMKEGNKTSNIFFSKIYGEKCTFVVKDNKIKSYGESVLKYTNPGWFLDQ